MHTSANRRSGTWLSRALVIFGLACLSFYGVVTLQAAIYQRNAKAEIDQMVSAQHTTAPAATAIAMPGAMRPLIPGEVIGRVDIPRLNMSAAVDEGDDD